MERTSKAHTSPDVVSHQDSPVPSTASEDVYCASKYTPTLSDSDSCSSEVSETLSHVEGALSHAYAVLEPSLTCDIKLHPPDKSHLNSPPLSVTSVSPKSPFDKVASVQHGSSSHNLCPTLYTGQKKKHLSCLGDKALGDENTHPNPSGFY